MTSQFRDIRHSFWKEMKPFSMRTGTGQGGAFTLKTVLKYLKTVWNVFVSKLVEFITGIRGIHNRLVVQFVWVHSGSVWHSSMVWHSFTERSYRLTRSQNRSTSSCLIKSFHAFFVKAGRYQELHCDYEAGLVFLWRWLYYSEPAQII
jgi:hypothetical protein